jgi:hypothetical protein
VTRESCNKESFMAKSLTVEAAQRTVALPALTAAVAFGFVAVAAATAQLRALVLGRLNFALQPVHGVQQVRHLLLVFLLHLDDALHLVLREYNCHRVYLEYQRVCPLVGIGTSPPPSSPIVSVLPS